MNDFTEKANFYTAIFFTGFSIQLPCKSVSTKKFVFRLYYNIYYEDGFMPVNTMVSGIYQRL